MNQPIPLHLFTGFLGSGKTTTIINLVQEKPENERWGILVNEFGDVAIDQSFLGEPSSQTVFVKEIPGGCMCCDAWLLLQVALIRLIREFRPDRILVEMTGLGHPEAVVKQLTGDTMYDAIEVVNTVCLVDPDQYFNERFREYPSYIDQIAIADIVLITTPSSVSSDAIAELAQKIDERFFPAKDIRPLPLGHAPVEILEKTERKERVVLFPDFHGHSHHDHNHNHSHDKKTSVDKSVSLNGRSIAKGASHRFENAGQDHVGCGWIFSPEDTFHHERLVQNVRQIMERGCLRIKGVFRTNNDVISINAKTNSLDMKPGASAEDSRVEILCDKEITMDWQEIEKQFHRCLV